MRTVLVTFALVPLLGGANGPISAEIVTKNESNVVKRIRQRAEKGDAVAQYMLGETYERGNAVSQDREKAKKWHRKAFQCFQLVAEQGDSFAQLWLGFMYTSGKGVAQDSLEAIKWYRMAAEQGDPIAQHALALIYSEPAPQNYVESYKWVKLVASKDRRLARKVLPLVAAKMTQEQLAEGKRLVREWKRQWKRKGKREWKRKRQERRRQFSDSIRCEW